MSRQPHLVDHGSPDQLPVAFSGFVQPPGKLFPEIPDLLCRQDGDVVVVGVVGEAEILKVV